jgi:alpha-galactosidase
LFDYTNNDVAIANSWTNGTNTRNLTIGINGNAPTRLELPLAGRSSELFSVDKGWDDSGTFGVLVDGLDMESGKAEVAIGNVGGADGVQPMGAEFVGMRVFW